MPVFDEVVNDPPLQLERYDFEQEDDNRQHRQAQLVPAAFSQYVAKDIAGNCNCVAREAWRYRSFPRYRQCGIERAICGAAKHDNFVMGLICGYRNRVVTLVGSEVLTPLLPRLSILSAKSFWR
jgi:hypothetical protein